MAAFGNRRQRVARRLCPGNRLQRLAVAGDGVGTLFVTPTRDGTATTFFDQQEPSGIYSTGAPATITNATPPASTIVIGYNDLGSGGSGGSGSVNGWAWVENVMPFTIHHCNFDTAAPDCGGRPVDRAPSQGLFLGDPTLAADRNGHVVYVSLALDPSQTVPTRLNRDFDVPYVVGALSNDGGRSFLSASRLDAQGPTNGCTGRNDQPHATFDLTGPEPILWVVWRHQQAASGANTGLCIGAYRINGIRNSLDQMFPPYPVPVLTESNAGGIGGGVGGAMVQAGRGAVTLVYSSTAETESCNVPTLGQTNTVHVRWNAQTNFSPMTQSFRQAVTIAETNFFAPCKVNSNISTSLRGGFGFVEDLDGTYYVAVNNAISQITLYQSANQGMSWRFPTVMPVPPQTTSVFYPTLASDVGGRLGLTYYAADSSNQLVSVQFVGTTVASDTLAQPGSPMTMRFQGPIQVSATFSVTPGNTRQLGDYMSLVPFPGDVANLCGFNNSTYFPIWTDISRSPANNIQTDIVFSGVAMTP